MRKFYTPFAAGFFMLLASSCTTSPNSGLTTEPIDVSVSENVRTDKVIGTWRGVIPCADCPGISYNLTLNEDNSYEETMIYTDRNAQPLTRTGTWQLNNGLLELDDPNEAYYRFSLLDGELLMLDKATGKPVQTQVATMYRLRKDIGVDTELAQWNDNSKRGIDFVGNGHNPGWLLEIDKESRIYFKTLPTETIVVDAPIPTPEVKGNKTTYRSKTDAGELVIELTNETCKDAMSGNELAYTVRVTAKGQVFQGCGLYLQESVEE